MCFIVLCLHLLEVATAVH
ncbi:hypothetical protein C5167_029241 [Papaver somniferum]|nr:hypothetical protein C5167_029241 [Papaver somniferum]